MSTHAHSAHGGHEMEDFEGHLAIWAIPFSFAMLFAFLFIVVLWVPAAVSRELKHKELEGAEVNRQSLLLHKAEQAEILAGSEGLPIDQAMAELVRKNNSETP